MSDTIENEWVPALKPREPGPEWSAYQLAIFREVAEGHGHTVVIARAGSGKTSTIVEAFRHVPRGKTTLVCAFNKEIEVELKKRAPSGVEVKTLHGYGFAAIRRANRDTRVEKNKSDIILALQHGSERSTLEFRRAVARAGGYCKGCLIDTRDGVDDVIDRFSLEVGGEGRVEDREKFITATLALLEASKADTASIDFDDMVWLPVVLGLRTWQYDRVFVDETQDLNPAQIQLALKACRSSGRICAVGDDRQAIYGFRGADQDAVHNVIRALNAKVMPLSVTYRCANAIVSVAKRYVPDLEAAPNAAEGVVRHASPDQMRDQAAPGDFILSRANAPLIGLCLGFLKEGRRASIQGKDIGANLVSLVNKSKAATVPELTGYVQKWCGREVARRVAMEPPKSTAAVEDKAACLYALCEGAQSVSEVLARITALFSDFSPETSIVLSTTHKAKGMERDRVFVIRDTYRPEKGTEEANLFYVAVTRARSELVLVVGKTSDE